MFTGIIEETGTVVSAERRGEILRVVVEGGALAASLAVGGSVAVNGCCLTAVEVSGPRFVCELTPETLARTAFGERLRPGARINLERPMRADGRFDGHIVQGHVDGVGRVVSLDRLGTAADLVIEPPAPLLRYLVEKGSVAVDGVSLTVAAMGPSSFTIALIPYTLDHTSLSDVGPGGPVNLEVDVIAKYVERLLVPHGV
jgi:riboflavin synthase